MESDPLIKNLFNYMEVLKNGKEKKSKKENSQRETSQEEKSQKEEKINL